MGEGTKDIRMQGMREAGRRAGLQEEVLRRETDGQTDSDTTIHADIKINREKERGGIAKQADEQTDRMMDGQTER